MSEAKSDSTVIAKKPKSPHNQKKKKHGKRFWKHTQKAPVTKDLNKAKKLLPPKDAQEFSSNWKLLQEVFKTKSVKTNPPTEKKKTQKKPIAPTTKTEKSVKPSHVNAEKTVKDATMSTPSLENGKEFSGTKESNAVKRKPNRVEADSEEPTSKRKKEQEERKPTEQDIWFDDVDPDDIEATVGTEAADIVRKRQGQRGESRATQSGLVKERAFEGLTRAVAMDCEMVGVGPDGDDSIVARVSLVNQFGKCIYDKFVKPTERVTDYRTDVSGIRPEDIKHGENVKIVQREVAEILQGRVLVGHAIHNDLKILLLDHPKKRIRDTQKYKPFRKAVKSGRPSLKLLCREILNVKVQQGEHSSVQDAQATMRLYTLVKKQWETEIKASHKNKDVAKKSERKPKAPKNTGNR